MVVTLQKKITLSEDFLVTNSLFTFTKVNSRYEKKESITCINIFEKTAFIHPSLDSEQVIGELSPVTRNCVKYPKAEQRH